MAQDTEKSDIRVGDGLCEFYLVVTPGLETLAQKEIARWLSPDTSVIVSRGGLTVRLGLAEGLALNRVLRIPTRVLLRIADFGCRDFPKLFKKTAGLDWSRWVGPGVGVEFVASSHKSRLFIKKRIEETCRDGFKRWSRERGSGGAAATGAVGAGAASGAGAVLECLVRFDDDICTMSLDTSGELLHKRGRKTLSADAPVRETIAAAMLEMMCDADTAAGGREPVRVGGPEPVGARGAVTLVDPMIGSGTFVIEAAEMGRPIGSREFAFEKFPNVPATPVDVRPPQVNFAKFVGFDIDAKAAEAARGNWRDARPLDVIVGDFFDAKPLAIEGERWLITNPPYGERLKIEGRLKDYYELLFETCERVVKPDRACFLLPDTAKPEKLRAPATWRRTQALKFLNGGLPVTAVLFVRDESASAPEKAR